MEGWRERERRLGNHYANKSGLNTLRSHSAHDNLLGGTRVTQVIGVLHSTLFCVSHSFKNVNSFAHYVISSLILYTTPPLLFVMFALLYICLCMCVWFWISVMGVHKYMVWFHCVCVCERESLIPHILNI